MIKVGKYVQPHNGKPEIIEREWYEQGYFFKDEDAFLNYEDKVCYISEFDDTKYTRKDILKVCDNQYELAKQCFYGLSWESPCTWILDAIYSGIWCECKECNHYFYIEDEENMICPFCANEN